MPQLRLCDGASRGDGRDSTGGHERQGSGFSSVRVDRVQSARHKRLRWFGLDRGRFTRNTARRIFTSSSTRHSRTGQRPRTTTCSNTPLMTTSALSSSGFPPHCTLRRRMSSSSGTFSSARCALVAVCAVVCSYPSDSRPRRRRGGSRAAVQSAARKQTESDYTARNLTPTGALFGMVCLPLSLGSATAPLRLCG